MSDDESSKNMEDLVQLSGWWLVQCLLDHVSLQDYVNLHFVHI